MGLTTQRYATPFVPAPFSSPLTHVIHAVILIIIPFSSTLPQSPSPPESSRSSHTDPSSPTIPASPPTKTSTLERAFKRSVLGQRFKQAPVPSAVPHPHYIPRRVQIPTSMHTHSSTSPSPTSSLATSTLTIHPSKSGVRLNAATQH